MVCLNCGNQSNENSALCLKCGAKLDGATRMQHPPVNARSTPGNMPMSPPARKAQKPKLDLRCMVLSMLLFASAIVWIGITIPQIVNVRGFRNLDYYSTIIMLVDSVVTLITLISAILLLTVFKNNKGFVRYIWILAAPGFSACLLQSIVYYLKPNSMLECVTMLILFMIEAAIFAVSTIELIGLEKAADLKLVRN